MFRGTLVGRSGGSSVLLGSLSGGGLRMSFPAGPGTHTIRAVGIRSIDGAQ